MIIWSDNLNLNLNNSHLDIDDLVGRVVLRKRHWGNSTWERHLVKTSSIVIIWWWHQHHHNDHGDHHKTHPISSFPKTTQGSLPHLALAQLWEEPGVAVPLSGLIVKIIIKMSRITMIAMIMMIMMFMLMMLFRSAGWSSRWSWSWCDTHMIVSLFVCWRSRGVKFPDISSNDLSSRVAEHLLRGLVDPGHLVLAVGDLHDVPHVVQGGEEALGVPQSEGRGDRASN